MSALNEEMESLGRLDKGRLLCRAQTKYMEGGPQIREHF